MRREKLPPVLTKLIITKFILSFIMLVGYILVTVFWGDKLYLGLLPGAFAIFIGMEAVATLYNGITENYVSVFGICFKVELSRFKRRINAVWIRTNRGKVKVLLRYKPKAIGVGDVVTVYAPSRASIYDKGDFMVMNEYYAISIAKKSN